MGGYKEILKTLDSSLEAIKSKSNYRPKTTKPCKIYDLKGFLFVWILLLVTSADYLRFSFELCSLNEKSQTIDLYFFVHISILERVQILYKQKSSPFGELFILK
ncbi:hypothetical protein SAMN04488508_106265 [Aquimarina spongiae]|uniref:Uncharacterized protein n=1 Tax=Aquimarina spongiae TaxID=570521 RepID=A0A1M6HGA4_9FLAO|nr:hypothetical protein SAMN04488508_106265 [Aquimarina spongiae]